ncbi:TIR domain-containing protein [Fusobacterium polymorphum]|uniref:TIR domain-containing protein n=1 Tax=Fusobacterium nucleatum subsp. polymorphum TaxID=76857 RepID=UPI001C6EEA40|nr:TIR domain-containing protein [Fusobacterium polymorphum]QYR59515.1 TIR domain-containing protein [Fusobacterium polymorphum]
MKEIFEQGEFKKYKIDNLQKSMNIGIESFDSSEKRVTVFISHKHDDLDDLKDIIGFLEKEFNVVVYIDSRDVSMPKVTSRETAEKIKEKIVKCDKFILLATDGAIESKWCNWELGFADAKKEEKVTLFPMKKKGVDYKGNEYMEIYSYITYFDGYETYKSGQKIETGYYVMTKDEDKKTIIPLSEWLKK